MKEIGSPSPVTRAYLNEVPLYHPSSPLFSYDIISLIQEYLPKEDAQNLGVALDGVRPHEITARLCDRVNLGIEPFAKLLLLGVSSAEVQNRWENEVIKIDASEFQGSDEEFLECLKRFPSVHSLILPPQFQASLATLPKEHLCHLQHLEMGREFNQILPEQLTKLQHLVMGKEYNQTLPNQLIKLRYLKMGWRYNKVLPKDLSELRHLVLGLKYGQLLPKQLVNLRHLDLALQYNKPLPKQLVNLQHLRMGTYYNKVLPSEFIHLEYLRMGSRYNQILPAEFINLQYLRTGASYAQTLPQTLEDRLVQENKRTWRAALPEKTDSSHSIPSNEKAPPKQH